MRYFYYPVLAGSLLVYSTSVYAIPSPDLVINLTASLAQVLGMVSVLLGGMFVSGKRSRKSGAASRAQGTSRIVVFGVLGVLVISACLNIWQYTRQTDLRTQQLSVNLHRKAVENGKELGGVSLQTLSFSDQISHPRGIETAALSSITSGLDNPQPNITLIDVREDEEVESGRIPGASHIRYPDLLQNPDLLKNESNVVLLCYSGNRSSELTSELAKRGIETRFMVGGYEKWMSEGRMLDVQNGDKQSLREIPAYPNRDRLLETAEVHDLIQNQDAVFIDVRYPADFATGHLPGAINLTVRAEPTASLTEKLSTLPKKPMIGACYDRRSCFYSQILGLKLSRVGIEFAGRYTVPHEYVAPVSGGGKQYVADWTNRNQASLIGLAKLKVGELISGLVEKTGNVFLVLCALIVAVRLPLLPLFIKTERDRLVQKRLGTSVAGIKSRFSSDHVKRGRAVQKLYKSHNIKPVLTLIVSLLNLGLLLFLFGVVNDQSAGWGYPVWWMGSAGDVDTSRTMAGLIAALVVILAYLSNRPMTKLKIGLIALGAAVIGLLVIPLSMAVNVYLVISLVVVLAQMGLVSILDKRYGWSVERSRDDSYTAKTIVPLSQAHHHLPLCGMKAAKLGELIEDGYNVPDGFVVPLGMINSQGSELSQQYQNNLSAAWKSVRGSKVAVRSSGVAEDTDNASFAGVYDSVLNVERNTLAEALSRVSTSLNSGVQSAYAQKQFTNGEQIASGGGALVQKMVDAEYAGVVFTEHPDSAGKILVEMVEGLGEALVGGTVSPESYSIGRRSFKCDRETPFDLTDLLKTVISIETKYGTAQDIEWAYSGGKFYILQTRDITRSVAQRGNLRGVIESQRRSLLAGIQPGSADEVVLRQNELSELLPRPTPLSASVMERLWDLDGSTHLACQRLGIPYDVTHNSLPYVNVFLGWLYVNKAEELKRTRKGPGALASFKLSRNADQIADEFEQEFLPRFNRRMDTLTAIDFDKMSVEQLVSEIARFTQRFVTETYVEAEVINICNQFYWNTASSKLKSSGIDPNLVLGKLPENVVSKAMNMLARSVTNPSCLDEFNDFYGHRSPTDYELANPRYCEDPALVAQQVEALNGKLTSHVEPVVLNNRMLEIVVNRVRRFQTLKEAAKHQCLREFYLIRRALLALDKKCQLDSGIFYLTIDEVAQLNDEHYLAIAKQLATIRRQQSSMFKNFTPPIQLTIADLEEFDPMAKESDQIIDRKDVLSGTRIAGQEVVSGVVHVIRDEGELDKFREGEILVARMTEPSWYPLFPLAKGIITEVGGWLSHAAIIAREYDLPAVVGVEDATAQLRSGDIVQINTDGTIERLSERRAPDSPMRVSVPAAVAARGLAERIITDPGVVPMPATAKPEASQDDSEQPDQPLQDSSDDVDNGSKKTG